MIVKWSEIEAECGDYRQGFVATFRKYEGQLTDEKDGQGRAVKVTASSFARHIGVDKKTFGRWVAVSSRGALTPLPRSKNDLTRDVLRAARHEPEAVVRGIMNAPQNVQDDIFHELKLRRAGEDRSPAARKAAEAGTHEAMAPMRRAIASTHTELCIQALNEAREALAEADAENAVSPEALTRIDRAHDAFVLTRHEVGFKVEVKR